MPTADGHVSAVRWDFPLRSALAFDGDCSRIAVGDAAIALDATNCSDTGCTGGPRPTRCDGTVATFGDAASGTTTRDCAESYQACDLASPTGCTDRPALSCDVHARDERCDGDVLLGCTESGFATFRDCSLQGGACAETASGAECRYPRPAQPCSIYAERCVAGKRTYCVAGEMTEIDCVAMGFAPCLDGQAFSSPTSVDSARDWLHACRPLPVP